MLHRRTWKHQLKPVLPKNLVNMGWPNRLTPKSVLKGPSTVAVKGDVLVCLIVHLPATIDSLLSLFV